MAKRLLWCPVVAVTLGLAAVWGPQASQDLLAMGWEAPVMVMTVAMVYCIAVALQVVLLVLWARLVLLLVMVTLI
jgi:hypothetical protein